MRTLRIHQLLLMAALSVLAPRGAWASVLFELGGVGFTGTGATLPDDALTILLTDTAANTVRVKIDGTNLPAGTAKVKDVVLNLDPAFVGGLTFTHVSGVVTDGAPSYSADGQNGWGSAKRFDIKFSFDTGGGGLGDFFPGSMSEYDIMGAGLDSTDFLFTSTGSTTTTLYYAAFHLNVTGNGQSGKYSAPGFTIVGSGTRSQVTPEPLSFFVWTLLIGGVAITRTRRWHATASSQL
jgi:hypothetical protein